MSYRTTAILAALVVLLGVGLIAYSFVGSSSSTQLEEILDKETRKALNADKAPQDQHLVITFGENRVNLERASGHKVWTMPGNWPTRSFEVNHLVAQVAGLKSRFVPVALTEKNKKTFGFDGKPAATVTLKIGDQDNKLEFGRPVPEPGNSFYQPSYLRLGDKEEVIRLAPGLVEGFQHPAEYYQQRWLLLPPEKQIRAEDSPAKSERFATVKSIRLTQKGGKDIGYTLTWNGTLWELAQPFKDKVDPNQLKSILAALPDIWAERFEANPKKDLSEYGLKDPEQALAVTLGDGRTVTILVGKQSRVDRRVVMQPPLPGGPPQPPRPQIIEEKFRYAKLQAPGQPLGQIFEIKADKLNSLVVSPDSLRDAELARFKPDDATGLEITWKGKQIVLAKENGVWQMTQPSKNEADSAKVQELLDKLSGLQARDKDVIDKKEPAAYGLDKPEGEIALTVEEQVKGADGEKTKKKKVLHFALGKQDAVQKKLYIKVDAWPRINAVEDSLIKLASRDALAYRGKQVLKFAAADLARIDIQRTADPFSLEQGKDGWRLKTPVQAEVDAIKVDQLTGDLSQLEAVEFVADNPRADDLVKQYGLGASALTAKVAFTDPKKKAEALLVGKQRTGKEEYYAKLDSGPAVFTIKKATHDTLVRPSLDYRPVQLWFMPADEIGELRIQKKAEYRLVKEGTKWGIKGPFEASAQPALVKPLTEELSNPKCEKYEAHFAKDLAKFGLDKPYLRVVLVPVPKKADKNEPKKEEKGPKERVLLIGNVVKAGSKDRFAKLGDSEAIIVLGEKAIASLDHEAVDLLDRALLSVPVAEIQRLQSSGKNPLTLERKGNGWQVSQSPAGAFAADPAAANTLAGSLAHLQAARFADYGPKVDLAKYGLQSPSVSLTITRQLPDKKTKTHILALGNEVKDAKGQRYVRVDNGQGVAILDAALLRTLTPGYLDLVSRSPWKGEASTITNIERRQDAKVLELARKGDGWEIIQPAKNPGDKTSLDLLAAQLANLRAEGVAAYPSGDLKKFGLDQPFAVVTARLTGADKKPADHILKIGGLHEEGSAKGSGQRYFLADKSTTVFILSGELARQLTGDPLRFRDRVVAHLAGADQVHLERGPRKAIFTRKDDIWKMTAPVEAETEQTALEEFLKELGALRAADLVAEKPAYLKPYGLDHPRAAWHFSLEGKEKLALLIGNPEKIKQGGKEVDGPRCYARLAMGDLVFLLDAQTTKRVLGEYRSRNLWPTPPDAAQVSQIRFGYRQNPFTLDKKDLDWQVVGKPEIKVDAEKIKDALAALSSLRAFRYVEDKGANLKLYGLDPATPDLILEVQSPAGPKVLHVGHQEGSSKRFYARIPDSPDAPVFLLGEEDSGRLVRKLKDFLSPKR